MTDELNRCYGTWVWFICMHMPILGVNPSTQLHFKTTILVPRLGSFRQLLVTYKLQCRNLRPGSFFCRLTDVLNQSLSLLCATGINIILSCAHTQWLCSNEQSLPSLLLLPSPHTFSSLACSFSISI